MPSPTAFNRTPFEHWCQDHLDEGASVRRGTRAGRDAASFSADDYFKADVLSVHFADGSVLHTAPSQWLADVGAAQADGPPAVSRAGQTGQTGDSGGNRVVLPFELRQPGGALRSGTAEAGALIDRYSLARLTPSTALDQVYQVGAWLADGMDRWFGGGKVAAAGVLAGKLCRAFESSLLHDDLGNRDGLLLHWHAGQWQPEAPPAAGATAAPSSVVLFLHGTASSTDGSFGGLYRGSDPGADLPADFAELAQTHRLLAWEHRSLTCSPVANALGLARALAEALTQALPAAAGPTTLHLVSHSRGGMVGDLLCIGLQPVLAQQVFEQLLNDFYPEEDDHPDRPLIAQLCAALRALASIQAGTFVRVACPARGTLLADRRTDLFLSLLLRSVGMLTGGNGLPWYERLNGLVRGLVAARAEARSIPGLEAMIPGSPLTLALNTALTPTAYTRPLPKLPGRLRVIAGDSATGLSASGVFTLVGDVFYGLHDHDFVVHTHSMFGGLVRADAKSLRLEDKTVHHLGYFQPQALARGPLFAALASQDDAFRDLADDEQATRGLWQALKAAPLCRRPGDDWRAAMADPARAGQAIVVVLPGIMGSELVRRGEDGADDEPVWLGVGALASGALRWLNPKLDLVLAAPSLMPVAYERLLEAAQPRYRLLPWPYDWRGCIQQAGLALRAELLRLLVDHPGTPIHLLAHSMGGLVARAALYGPDEADAFARPAAATPQPSEAANTLRRKLKSSGGRLLMLGTPNQGSYAPVQLMLQQHALSHFLATVARKVSPEDMARWGGEYAGLMQMLPHRADEVYGDLSNLSAWQAMRDDDSLAQLPDRAALAQAERFRAWLTAHFDAVKNDEQVLYVAGRGDTPCALLKPQPAYVAMGEGQAGPLESALRFALSAEGDGVVSWASCLKPERTWVADCEHGDLADDKSAFAAYFELLDSGRTQALPQMSPQSLAAHPLSAPTRSAAGVRGEGLPVAPYRVAELPSLPADPAAYVLGLRPRVPGPQKVPPIEVRVVHGGLDYARYPLIVGHYQGDGILGGTQRADEKLSGQLGRMVALKLFTGAARTSVYLRPPTDDSLPPAYAGAIVVGLGMVGELSPSTLSATVTRAVLRYAFDHLHRDPWVPGGDGPVLLRLSTLLIGTHVQAVSARDSLVAVLGGIARANQHLVRGTVGRPMRVVELEVIEILEQQALDAAYELKRLLDRDEWKERLVWRAGTLESRSGRIRGYRPSHNASVWQRLVVRHQPSGGLRFELIAERARVEATQVQADVASLKQFIQQMSDADVRAGVSENPLALGQVLYQLLLPLSLKSRLLNLEDSVLVLDDASAAYPWELMVPPEDEGGPGDGPSPLAIQAGMVRQRVADDFRALPTLTTAYEALVVGAPDTSGWRGEDGQPLRISSLPGAEQEARNVTQLLAADRRPWRTTLLVGAQAPFQRVRMALLSQPYRLLHLCGHGVVDFWVENTGAAAQPQALRKTGLLLNQQQILTAADVEQMGSVPELVFINGCYSGREPASADLSAVQRNLPLLASSLALQFIKMGSRAVVAAGWQVDDETGLAFAQALYRGLLTENRSFGEAVLEARRLAHRQGRGGNTWGAYQCYGDPHWRLGGDGDVRGFAQQYGSSRLQGAATAMSRSELTDRVLQVVALAGDKPRAALLMQLSELERSLRDDEQRKAWLDHSGVRSAFGQAYRELGDHERAVQWLQLGARNAYSRVSLREVEFMVNSLSRLGDADSHRIAQTILDRLNAIDDDSLLYKPPLPVRAPSSAQSERDCLRGSDRMHQARGTADAQQQADHYAEACRLFSTGYAGKLNPRDSSERRAYAMANSMLCAGLALMQGAGLQRVRADIEALRQHHGDGAGWEAHCAELLDEIEALGVSTSFWHYTNSLELISARTLLRVAIRQALARKRKLSAEEQGWRDDPSSALPRVQADLAKAQRLLRHALVRWPSPVEAESIGERFAAVQAVCAQALQRTGAARVAADLKPMVEALQAHAAGALKELRDLEGRLLVKRAKA